MFCFLNFLVFPIKCDFFSLYNTTKKVVFQSFPQHHHHHHRHHHITILFISAQLITIQISPSIQQQISKLLGQGINCCFNFFATVHFKNPLFLPLCQPARVKRNPTTRKWDIKRKIGTKLLFSSLSLPLAKHYYYVRARHFVAFRANKKRKIFSPFSHTCFCLFAFSPLTTEWMMVEFVH
jgi:hypothetical protein